MDSKPVRDTPMAVSDIAKLLGVSVHTVNQWRRRAATAKKVEPFPPPAGKTGQADYWWKEDILGWARRTGRLTAEQSGS